MVALLALEGVPFLLRNDFLNIAPFLLLKKHISRKAAKGFSICVLCGLARDFSQERQDEVRGGFLCVFAALREIYPPRTATSPSSVRISRQHFLHKNAERMVWISAEWAAALVAGFFV